MAQNKILIIDDQQEIRNLLSKYLNSIGYDTKTAVDGQDGLFILEQWNADLVTVDLNMPVLNGRGFLQKSLERWPDIPVVVVSGMNDVDQAVESMRLGAHDYITKPIVNLSLIDTTIIKALRSAELARENRNYQQNLQQMVEKRTIELEETKRQLLYSLGTAAEYRDNETGRHVIRVGKICGIIGRALGMGNDEIKTFQESSPLHDIGKIGISDDILLKPSRLSDQEWQTMKRHCEIGCNILRHYSSSEMRDQELYSHVISMANSGRELSLLEMAMVIALCHHEQWDGSGYPLKLAGKEIPLTARVVACVDVYDALGSERPYKKPMAEEQCQEILKQGSGSHFDPAIIEAFFENIDQIIEVKQQWMD